MTALLRPNLRSGHSSVVDQLWVGNALEQSAERVSQALFGPATLLPLTVFAGARGFPVVTWNAVADDVVRPRYSHALDNASTSSDADLEALYVRLSIVAFIGVGRPVKVRTELAGVRAITRTVAMMPFATRWRGLSLAEFDAQGTAVVLSDGDKSEVLVGGDAGPRPGSALAPAWRRAFEAQLVEWSTSQRGFPTP